MAQHVTTQSEIPQAPFYVTLTDTFMSGWGKAKNLTNRLVFPCEDMDEAIGVSEYAKSRTDTKNVRICTVKPQIKPWQYVHVMDPDHSVAWYRRGGGK